jgi:hypothetical protein
MAKTMRPQLGHTHITHSQSAFSHGLVQESRGGSNEASVPWIQRMPWLGRDLHINSTGLVFGALGCAVVLSRCCTHGIMAEIHPALDQAFPIVIKGGCIGV